jgi:hypothetical protein
VTGALPVEVTLPMRVAAVVVTFDTPSFAIAGLVE